jgi:hypothetical protein
MRYCTFDSRAGVADAIPRGIRAAETATARSGLLRWWAWEQERHGLAAWRATAVLGTSAVPLAAAGITAVPAAAATT